MLYTWCAWCSGFYAMTARHSVFDDEVSRARQYRAGRSKHRITSCTSFDAERGLGDAAQVSKIGTSA